MSLKIGDLAPEFETNSQSDENVSSKGNKGKKYVLYFYPRDNTPGCIKEACSIRDNYQTFLDNDIPVYGVSGGNAQSHQKFIDKFDLPFPLLMDEKFDLAKKFGAYKRGNRVARITYLINEEGIIEGIFGTEGQEKVEAAEHSSQIINFWKL
ncbi:MAG: peroxiredoxin [Promethearchaeota archaeon]|jgi:peroxiredoxin Q/BCP